MHRCFRNSVLEDLHAGIRTTNELFMREKELSFVVPTHRLREVGETIEQYGEHFWRNGHSVRMVVFDDSSPTNQQKYYPLLEQTHTHQELHYVGPREKEQFLAYLNSRLRDRRLEGLVRNLFRPSYGGNRNFTLMYTRGELMVSSDDDMRPYSLIEDSPESLGAEEVCRGRLHKTNENGYTRKSLDIVAAFWDVLGKPVSAIPENYDRGELLIDSASDLETDVSKGLARENSLTLKPGAIPDTSGVKIAQTFRSGTNDIDAVDFVEMFLEDEEQTILDDLNERYVLVNFRAPGPTGIGGWTAAWPATTIPSGCPRFSPPVCASKITFTGSGFNRRALLPPTWMPRRITLRATTCATLRRPKSSTKRRGPRRCSSPPAKIFPGSVA